jgi:hypothetical protein
MLQDPKIPQSPVGEVSGLKSMEEARLDLPHSRRKFFARIWDEATHQIGGNVFHQYILGTPTPQLISAIEGVLGRPIKAKRQIIQLGYVKHINNRHGAGGAVVNGQVPITKELFALIPDVLENFDSVEKGHATSGGDGVLIRRRYSDGAAVLVNAVANRGNLEIRSFRIENK